jgi:hypothetical protein
MLIRTCTQIPERHSIGWDQTARFGGYPPARASRSSQAPARIRVTWYWPVCHNPLRRAYWDPHLALADPLGARWKISAARPPAHGAYLKQFRRLSDADDGVGQHHMRDNAGATRIAISTTATANTIAELRHPLASASILHAGRFGLRVGPGLACVVGLFGMWRAFTARVAGLGGLSRALALSWSLGQVGPRVGERRRGSGARRSRSLWPNTRWRRCVAGVAGRRG